MGRRSHHEHWPSGKTISDGHRELKIPICKKEPSFLLDFTNQESRVSCPQCAQILANNKLAARSPDEPKLEFVKEENQIGYRFPHRILVDGAHVGWIVYEGAYGGGGWYIVGIRLPDKHYKTIRGGYILSDTNKSWSKGKSYPVKEAALLDVPFWITQGELKSVEQKEREAKEYAERRARIEAEETAEKEAALKRINESLTGLDELIHRQLPLTNFQRDAIFCAIEHLQSKKQALKDGTSY